MAIPTISLALIAKNEEKNINRLLDSIEGCFQEIILVDTGSTDRTKEIALERGCKVFDFEWVNDFSKARNFSFSKASCDFVMWMDLDDVLHNKDNFIHWRDHAMQFTDLTFATYHYALDQDSKPIISFVRERVFRRSVNPQWQYPIHEGIICSHEWSRNYITTWSIHHLRDAEDIAQDKSRNLKILEQIQDHDARLTFYYGKELYEASKHFEAIQILEKASKLPTMDGHDRILTLQYAGYAAMACAGQIKDELREEKLSYFAKAIEFGREGVKLDPHRAEFFITIGDSLIQMGQLKEAIPYFAAAKACINPKDGGSPYEGAIYSFVNCYGELPSLQLSKIYFHLGQLDKAKKEAQECFDLYKNNEAKLVIDEANRVEKLIDLDQGQLECEDIVFTCPPHNAMEFDEELYQSKGCGGSETALVEMAKSLKELTKRPVKVFNMRQSELVCESGVEYIPNSKLTEYMSKNRPKMHIAWRHNIKCTLAKTYLWCHDLFTPTVEGVQNFDKIMCLTPFHKDYVKGLQGVKEEKIWVTRNGVNPEKFQFERKPKNPNKIVWMSSADRGLDSCMLVMDKVVQEFPAAELHVYYGVDNLYKYGPKMSALADKLKSMMSSRPYVKYHGFTEQKKMYQEVSDAVIWLHPCNWIETSCITAMEMLALGIYPVTRALGALNDTLKEAKAGGYAVLLNHEFDHDTMKFTEQDTKMYYNEVCKALLNRSWEKVNFDFDKHSWLQVAKEWIEEMKL
jgi:glycosyltransferase involved in cell wall biosynthesis